MIVQEDEDMPDKSLVLDDSPMLDPNAIPCGATGPCCGSFFNRKCFKLRHRTDQAICSLSCIAMFCVLFGVILPIVVDELVQQGVTDVLVVDSPSADMYDSFLSNTKPGDQAVYYDFYMFDLTNPDGFLYNGEKPKMMEKGPFPYHYLFNRFDIDWTDGGNIVQYRTQYFYVWDEHRAVPGLPEDSPMRTPWITAMSFKVVFEDFAASMGTEGMLAKAQQLIAAAPSLGNVSVSDLFDGTGYMGVMKIAMCVATASPSPIIEMPVTNTEFGYWDDPLMLLFEKLLETLAPGVPWYNFIPGICSNYTSIEDARKRSNLDFVYTGKRDIHKVQKYIYYQNMTSEYVCPDATASPGGFGDNDLEIEPTCGSYHSEWTQAEAAAHGWYLAWDGPPEGASAVHGTTGLQFPPQWDNDKKNERTLFLDDIYRTLTLDVKSNTKVGSIHTQRLGIREQDLQSANCGLYPDDCNPDNADFYMFGLKGVLNFSKVAAGIPYFASKPHYLDADPAFIEDVEGVTPSRDLHDTFLDLDPYTGLVLSAAERLQYLVNLADWDMPSLPLYKYYNWSEDVVLPIRQSALAKAEAAVAAQVQTFVVQEVEAVCNASSAKHAARCSALGNQLEALLEQSCAGVNATANNGAAAACDALATMRQLVNKTAELVPEVIEYCQANEAACASVAATVKSEVAAFCSTNHTVTHALCVVADDIVEGVVGIWTALDDFCHDSECTVIHNVVEALQEGEVRVAIAEHCSDKLETREARCAAIDADIANVTATVCSGSGHANAPEFCAFVEEAVFEYTQGEFIAQIQTFCSSSIKNKGLCAGAEVALQAFCVSQPAVCNVTDFVIENWAEIDQKLLTVLGLFPEFCASTLCTSVDTVLLEMFEVLSNKTCHEHGLACDTVHLLEAGNLTQTVEQAIQALESDAEDFCSQDQVHEDVCSDVKSLGKDVVVDMLNDVFEQLGIQDQVAEAEAVYECLAMDTDYSMPDSSEGGTYIPIGWSARGFTADDDSLNDLQEEIFDTKDLADTVAWWLFAAAVIAGGVALGLSAARLKALRDATRAGRTGSVAEKPGSVFSLISADVEELSAETEGPEAPLVHNAYQV